MTVDWLLPPTSPAWFTTAAFFACFFPRLARTPPITLQQLPAEVLIQQNSPTLLSSPAARRLLQLLSSLLRISEEQQCSSSTKCQPSLEAGPTLIDSFVYL